MRRLSLAIALAASSGCTISPTQVEPDGLRGPVADWELPSAEQEQLQERLRPTPYVADNAGPWWEVFNDPVLSQLVGAAQSNAVDIRTAVSQLLEAQSVIRATRADRIPTVRFESALDLEQPDFADDKFKRRRFEADANVAFVLDWQIDLFNRIKSSITAAEARAGSAEALLRDLKRLITANTIATYVQARNLQARADLSQRVQQRRIENVERAKALLERKYGTVLDVRRSENQLYQSRAEGVTLSSAVVRLSNQLSVLTIQPLSQTRDDLDTSVDRFSVPDDVPFPDIEQLLAQRPDLRANEQLLLAAAAEVDQSKAALYPSLSLRTDLFSTNFDVGSFPSLTALSARVLSNLASPLLFRGRLLANVDASNARLEGALATYENSVVAVVAEIDTALNELSQTREIHSYRQLAATAAREAAEASKQLFDAGEVDYVSVIVAEQTRANAADAELAAERDAILAYVDYMSAVAPAW